MKKWVCVLAVFSLLLCGCAENDGKSEISSQTRSVAPVVAKPAMTKMVEIKGTDSGLNIRKASESDAQILGLAENGQKFLLISHEDENWYQIEYEGDTAFVSATYSQVIEVTEQEAKKITGTNSSQQSVASDVESSHSVTSSSQRQEESTSLSSEEVGAYRSRKPKPNGITERGTPTDGDME